MSNGGISLETSRSVQRGFAEVSLNGDRQAADDGDLEGRLGRGSDAIAMAVEPQSWLHDRRDVVTYIDGFEYERAVLQQVRAPFGQDTADAEGRIPRLWSTWPQTRGSYRVAAVAVLRPAHERLITPIVSQGGGELLRVAPGVVKEMLEDGLVAQARLLAQTPFGLGETERLIRNGRWRRVPPEQLASRLPALDAAGADPEDQARAKEAVVRKLLEHSALKTMEDFVRSDEVVLVLVPKELRGPFAVSFTLREKVRETAHSYRPRGETGTRRISDWGTRAAHALRGEQVHRIPMAGGANGKSFELTVDAPAGTFVGGAVVREVDTDGLLVEHQMGPTLTGITYRRNPEVTDAEMFLTLVARPGGYVVAAFVISMWQALIMVILTFAVLSSTRHAAFPGDGSAAVVVATLVPSIGGPLLIGRRPSAMAERLNRAARWAIVVVAFVTSLVAMLVALQIPGSENTEPGQSYLDIGIATGEKFWYGLAVTLLVLAVFLAYQFFRLHRLYRALLRTDFSSSPRSVVDVAEV